MPVVHRWSLLEASAKSRGRKLKEAELDCSFMYITMRFDPASTIPIHLGREAQPHTPRYRP